MSRKIHIPLILDNVDLDLHVELTPLKVKLFQHGIQLKRYSKEDGGKRYIIQTTDGGDKSMLIKGNTLKGRQAVYKEVLLNLEKPFSIALLAFMFLPIIVLIFTAVRLGIYLDITSGLILTGIGLITTFINLILNRRIENIKEALILNVILSVAGLIVFYGIAIILIMIELFMQAMQR